MPSATVSNPFKKITSFFAKKVSSLSKSTGFNQRSSKLSGRAFVEVLLGSCLNEDTRYEAQCSLLRQKKISITKQGLSQRMNAKALQLLCILLDEALVEFKSERPQVFELLAPFSGVKIQDSTGIELPSKLRSLFKGHGGDASNSSLKLQVLYDDINCSIDKLFVTDGIRNDQSFRQHLDTVQAGALYLQDLGYFRIQSFKEIADAGAYFLSRYLPQTKLYDMDGKTIDLLKLLRDTRSSYYEANVLLGKNQRLPIRLVAQRLDDMQKTKRLKNIHKSYKKMQPSRLILELAGWSIYVTNIPETILSKQNIHNLYVMRWQIELFFKLIKSHAKLNDIRGKTTYRILCELYAKLIVIIIFLHIAAPWRWLDNNRELSLTKAYLLFKASALPFLQTLASPYRLKNFLSFLGQQFLSCALKDKATSKKISSYQKIQLLGQQDNVF